MKIYISGPMTGIDDYNRPAFAAAQKALEAAGYEVVNPHEVVPDGVTDWRECMKHDIAALVWCDGVAMLEGCEASRGARIECDLARDLGMTLGPLEAWVHAKPLDTEKRPVTIPDQGAGQFAVASEAEGKGGTP